MRPFNYFRATTGEEAVKTVSSQPKARYLGGGTNLLDLMKDNVESASDLVDLTRVPLTEITEYNGGVSISALAKNSDTANHELIRTRYPLLSHAMLGAASAQIRNMATNGGNLLQRTRCGYFYDTALPCNKRAPGTGCGARDGLNRMHAIFGASDQCVAVHPSDMAVALAALDAKIHVLTPKGTVRIIPIADFHRLPGDHPESDNTLQHGELIARIELPPPRFMDHSYYLKVRDRTSYAFALISVAAALELDGNTIKDVRLAMGGVAHKPWRAHQVEKALIGKKATEQNFAAGAEAEMKAAQPLAHNGYKVELGKRAIVRALLRANGTV